MGNIMEEAFTAYTGSEKVFTLNGKELVIPADLMPLLHIAPNS